MDIPLISGITGMVLILVAFLLNQVQTWKSDNISYDLTNFIGSSLLCYYSVTLNSIPFITINAVWALFSLKDVLKYLIRKT